MYRMPTVFGPSLGPRQGPEGDPYPEGTSGSRRRTAVSIEFATEGEALRRLLPPRFEIGGEPTVKLVFSYLEEIGWLAGRGYNIFSVQIPCTYHGQSEEVTGEFVPVLWENLADPIITGREELGMPKLYAEIPPLVWHVGTVRCRAGWGGFSFVDAEVTDLRTEDVCQERAAATINRKYLPRTGEWGRADADYVTIGSSHTAQVTEAYHGRATFSFHSGSWQELPTLCNIVGTLADLPVLEVFPAAVRRLEGAGDYIDQRIVDSPA